MTPKRQVLKKYPKAFANQIATVNGWYVTTGRPLEKELSFGCSSPMLAWKKAAQTIKTANA